MRAHAIIFSANKYFQIKVLNPYRVFVDRYERDSVVVGIVGMCITAVLWSYPWFHSLLCTFPQCLSFGLCFLWFGIVWCWRSISCFRLLASLPYMSIISGDAAADHKRIPKRFLHSKYRKSPCRLPRSSRSLQMQKLKRLRPLKIPTGMSCRMLSGQKNPYRNSWRYWKTRNRRNDCDCLL